MYSKSIHYDQRPSFLAFNQESLLEQIMQFSIGVEYAFHSLFYMVELPEGKTIGIKHIAELNNIKESYLSKIFTKLRKGGIVRSIPGVNGGYELARPPDEITFWDVFEAIEGASHFFQCAEIRKNNIFVEDSSIFSHDCPCLIKVVMHEGEQLFREHLQSKSIKWLFDQVSRDFSEDRTSAFRSWIKSL